MCKPSYFHLIHGKIHPTNHDEQELTFHKHMPAWSRHHPSYPIHPWDPLGVLSSIYLCNTVRFCNSSEMSPPGVSPSSLWWPSVLLQGLFLGSYSRLCLNSRNLLISTCVFKLPRPRSTGTNFAWSWVQVPQMRNPRGRRLDWWAQCSRSVLWSWMVFNSLFKCWCNCWAFGHFLSSLSNCILVWRVKCTVYCPLSFITYTLDIHQTSQTLNSVQAGAKRIGDIAQMPQQIPNLDCPIALHING